MKTIFKRAYKFQRQHPILSNSTHAIGSFGLAICLQQYLVGNPFLPVAVGWILMGLAVIEHIYSMM